MFRNRFIRVLVTQIVRLARMKQSCSLPRQVCMSKCYVVSSGLPAHFNSHTTAKCPNEPLVESLTPSFLEILGFFNLRSWRFY